ncbi:DUF1853 family protein [Alkanindiges sp. WGS2144]|uniref:DUF1853 family protein n=1 Tax=Alkanindiges sp. WGS2144 TaxID=3366808 RepID=UPI003753E793
MNAQLISPPWLQFKHPIVRELAFSIASPPLLHSWPNTPDLTEPINLPDAHFWRMQFEQYLPRLKQLDQNPHPLEQHMLQLRSTRLGIRFEHLLTFWLQDDSYHPFKLIGQSVKRMEGQRTVGELDFLIHNQDTGLIEHWEVAIKFYLGEAGFFAEDWLGLNRRDSLGRKINHLQQHQFNVNQVNDITINTRRAIIKGRLFYPPGSLRVPDWVAKQHLHGNWGNNIPSTPSHYIWRRASRPEWIVPQYVERPAASLTYWTSGLYFLLNFQNQVVTQYMLRIADKRHKPL